MKHLFLAVSFLAFAISPNALGESYNYSYGDSRVVVQTRNGLAQPSSSYIGPGTLSKSAQGAIETGAQVNPGLPKVNRGSYFGTPGDNMYGAHPIFSNIPNPQAAVPTRRMIYRVPKPAGNTYVPGQNVPAEYSDSNPGATVQIDSKGAASYGPSSNPPAQNH